MLVGYHKIDGFELNPSNLKSKRKTKVYILHCKYLMNTGMQS